MRKFKTLTATSVIALLAGPALADVTAEQIWQSWQTQTQAYGMTMQAESETRDGDRLIVSGITFTFDMPEGSAAGAIDQFTFRERGDGTVAISGSPEYLFKFAGKGSDGENMAMDLVMRQPGFSAIASGNPGSVRMDFQAPEFGVGITQMEVNDEPIDIEVDVSISGIGGFYEQTNGTPVRMKSDVTAESVTMLIDAVAPDGEEGKFEMRFQMTDLASTSDGAIANVGTSGTLSEMLEAGLDSTGTMSYGPTNYTMAVDGPDGALNIIGGAESGELDFALNEDGIDYGGVNRGIALEVSGSAIPFPQVSIAMAESGGRLQMPLTPSDESKPFALSMRMVDLTVSDFLWSMFDAGQVLPRDPATIILDISGNGALSMDITDPEAMESSGGQIPGQLEDITLNELRLSIAGAELTGQGSAEFDNSGPMPVPAGSIDLTLDGANALLDNLVSMGLLPQDQAMGARMMMGMFARPGDGEDSLVSNIELKEDGAVLANGQRIR